MWYIIYNHYYLKKERYVDYVEVDVSVENWKIQHDKRDAVIREEEANIWKNMVRIEQLKREKLRKKDEILRKSLQAN